ncbi:MAG: lytic transglycosylase domain-containing protein, partial [Actinomycetes bacterium]
ASSQPRPARHRRPAAVVSLGTMARSNRIVTTIVALTIAAAATATTTGCSLLSGLSPTPVEIPAAYQPYFVVAAKRCPKVLTAHQLAAQAYAESKFDPAAVSAAGAQGMMQIMPEVWQVYGVDADGNGVKDPFNPADSIATAAVINCFLAKEVASVKGDRIELRLAAYNAGPDMVIRYQGVPPFPETESYVQKVIALTLDFDRRLASSSPSASASSTSH